MKKLAYFLMCVCFYLPSYAQTNFPAIAIDTDGAIDDFRAITAFLSIHNLNIIAISTASGSLTSKQALEKVDRLITTLSRPIPIAQGSLAFKGHPAWREACEHFNWGSKQRYWPPKIEASTLLDQQLNKTNGKVVYVALGSLTNLANFIRMKKKSVDKLEKVIWYNPNIKKKKGFNYEIDKSAFETVLNSGLKIEIISNLKQSNLNWNNDLIHQLSDSISSSYLLKQRFLKKELHSDISFVDELLAIYFVSPELFKMKTDLKYPNLKQVTAIDCEVAKKRIIEIFNNKIEK